MASTDVHVTFESSEKSPLLNDQIKNSVVTSDRQESYGIEFRNDQNDLFFFLNSYRRRSSTSVNEATKAQRFRAIRICYFGMFVSSIVFSITVSSLWPFLQIVY